MISKFHATCMRAIRYFVLPRRLAAVGVSLALVFGVVVPAYATIVGDPLGILKVGTTSSDNPNAPIAIANGGTTSHSQGPCLAVITCPSVGLNTTGTNGPGTLTASGTGYSSGYVSASGTGSSDGDAVTVSGIGGHSGNSTDYNAIAVAGTGSATGDYAASGTGKATGYAAAVSGTGSATQSGGSFSDPGIAASGTNEASAASVAASGTGNSTATGTSPAGVAVSISPLGDADTTGPNGVGITTKNTNACEVRICDAATPDAGMMATQSGLLSYTEACIQNICTPPIPPQLPPAPYDCINVPGVGCVSTPLWENDRCPKVKAGTSYNWQILERSYIDWRGCETAIRRGASYATHQGWGYTHLVKDHGWNDYQRNLTRQALRSGWGHGNLSYSAIYCVNYTTPGGRARTWRVVNEWSQGVKGIITAYYKPGYNNCP